MLATVTLDSPSAADLALGLELGQHAELLGDRHLRVEAVQLEQIEPLGPQLAQRQLGLLSQVLRPTRPVARFPGPVATRPTLVAIRRPGGYGCSASARISSLTFGPVRVGRVDEVDAELDGPSERR